MRHGVLIGGIADGLHKLFVGPGIVQAVLSGAVQPETDSTLLDKREHAVLGHGAALQQMQNLAEAQRLRVGSGQPGRRLEMHSAFHHKLNQPVHVYAGVQQVAQRRKLGNRQKPRSAVLSRLGNPCLGIRFNVTYSMPRAAQKALFSGLSPSSFTT